MLLGYARRLLELNDEAVRRFTEPEATGEIRLGVVEYFVPAHLPGVLARFARIYPRVHIDVKVGMSSSLTEALEIGRASCRERVCSVRVDLGGRRIIKKKKVKNNLMCLNTTLTPPFRQTPESEYTRQLLIQHQFI